jgi:hypothetical protein
MGATGMATTAAGTAVLVYLVLSGRLCGDAAGDGGGEDQLISSAVSAAAAARRRGKEEARARQHQRRKRRWPERAPDGWGEAAAVAARTVRLTWAETLGKWALGELAFGIKYYMRQQVRACQPIARGAGFVLIAISNATPALRSRIPPSRRGMFNYLF